MSATRSPSRKAKQTADTILDAAESVLIDAGYGNFTMRRVAATAGVTLGNLQYHFPSKELLIRAMLNHCIGRYLAWFASIRDAAGPDPRDQFRDLVRAIFEDLNSRNTTMFFPELWSLANHEPSATGLMDEMYAQYRAVLIDVVLEINPALDDEAAERLALFISASMEGHTVFVGHGKPWRDHTEALIALATESFLHLIDRGP